MIAATVLSIAGLGFACWLLFTLAVYALPFFAAVWAGMLAYESGAGPLGAIAIGLVAGAFTLVLGQFAFAKARSPALRALIALLFAAPAVLAGYSAVYGLSGIGGTSEAWRQALAVIGALVVGFTAWSRMAIFLPEPAQPRADRLASAPVTAAANDG